MIDMSLRFVHCVNNRFCVKFVYLKRHFILFPLSYSLHPFFGCTNIHSIPFDSATQTHSLFPPNISLHLTQYVPVFPGMLTEVACTLDA